MSPQQAIREKGKSFPRAVDWLQRHSENATATRGPQRQFEDSTRRWQIQAACLCLLPTHHGDKSLSSTTSAAASHASPASLGVSFWVWLPEIPTWGGRSCYSSLSLGGFDSVLLALASSMAWHILRHPHTAVRYNAAPRRDLSLSKAAGMF